MRTKTAEKVVDLLGLVELWLLDGRPRKPPGKPRPDATTFDGYDLKNPSPDDVMNIKNVSLPTAFRVAAKEMGYSNYVLRIAAMEFGAAYNLWDQAWWETPMAYLAAIDGSTGDTRELRRIARAARRLIERTDLS